MKRRPPESSGGDGDRDLEQLFARTAQRPDTERLRRAARAAAHIPERAPRGFWARLFRARPLELAVAALVGAAAVGAGVWLWQRGGSGGPDPLVAVVDDGAGDLFPDIDDAEMDAILEFDVAELEDVDVFGFDDPLAAVAGAGAGPYMGMDLLFGPPEGVDVGAWSAAYDALLDEEGG